MNNKAQFSEERKGRQPLLFGYLKINLPISLSDAMLSVLSSWVAAKTEYDLV